MDPSLTDDICLNVGVFQYESPDKSDVCLFHLLQGGLLKSLSVFLQDKSPGVESSFVILRYIGPIKLYTENRSFFCQN